MTSTTRRYLQLLISAALAIVFLVIAFRNQDLGKIWEEILHIHLGWALLFIPVSLTSHVVRAWRWKYFLTPVKADVRVKNLFSSVMIGYFFNSVLPRVGELARPYSLKKLENIPISTALGSVIVERVLDVISLVFIFAATLFYYREPLRHSFPWMESGSIILFAGSVLFLFFMFALTLWSNRTIAIVHRLLRWLPSKALERIEQLMRTFIDGLLVIHNREKYLFIALLTLVMWFLYTLQLYVVFFAFDGIAGLDFLAAMVLMVISSIGILIPMPGGIGTYHFFCSQGLIQMFAIPSAVALSFATITHGVGLIFMLIAGAIILVINNFKFSETQT